MLQFSSFGALVVALVIGMGSTVLVHARRSLRHEAYLRRFTLVGLGLMAACSLMALSADLVLLTISWVLISRLAVELIKTGPSVGVAQRSLRAQRSFVAGDLALIIAAGVLVAATGSTAIADVGRAGTPALALVSVLLVIAAASRSASGPFVRWLPDSLGAPTPSSALLHAGVVNGGAILLIKLGPASTEPLPGAIAALLIGGITCVFAEAVMLTRPDVKGRLAWSTIAQMSFTLLMCGLGLHVAAGLHLVAHGLYKGALFLGSGNGVKTAVRSSRAPGSPASVPARAFGAGAAVIIGLTMVVTVAVSGTSWSAELAVPAGLAWVAATCAALAWGRRSVSRRGRAAAVGVGAGSMVTFLAVTLALKHLVSAELHVTDPAVSPWLVVPVLVGLMAVAVAPRSLPVWRHIRAAGRPTAAPRLHLPGPLAWRPERATTAAHQPAVHHIGA